MNRSLLTALVLVPCLAAADSLEDGKSLLKQRDYKGAIVQLDLAAKTDATGEATYCLAIAYDLSGEPTKAIESYRKVVESKGKRAADAEKSMKSLEAGIAAATAVDRARVDFQRGGLESSTRLKEAHERVDKATIKHAQRQLDAQKIAKDRDAAIAAADKAERDRLAAEKVLRDWKHAGLTAPEDRGIGRRYLGTSLFILGGVGVGASVWYARTATTANDSVQAFLLGRTMKWSDELERDSIWGPRSDARLPYTIAIGGGALVLGAFMLGRGEAASQEAGDSRELTSSVEGAP